MQLASADPEERRAAVRALERLGQPKGLAWCGTGRDLELETILNIGRAFKRVVPTEDLVSALLLAIRIPLTPDELVPRAGPREYVLASAEPKPQVVAVSLLEELGPRAGAAIPELLRLLEEAPHPGLRRQVATTLGRLGAEPGVLPALLKAVHEDDDPQVRHAGLRALGEVGPAAKEVAPALWQMYWESQLVASDDHQPVITHNRALLYSALVEIGENPMRREGGVGDVWRQLVELGAALLALALVVGRGACCSPPQRSIGT